MIRTYSVTITNVGAEVGDFKLAKLPVAISKGLIRYVRVNSTTHPDTSYDIAIWVIDRAVWDPEHPDCVYWVKEVDARYEWMRGDKVDIEFRLPNASGLTNEILVGIHSTTAGATDDYDIQVDIDTDVPSN